MHYPTLKSQRHDRCTFRIISEDVSVVVKMFSVLSLDSKVLKPQLGLNNNYPMSRVGYEVIK